jgi:hypothetical protein
MSSFLGKQVHDLLPILTKTNKLPTKDREINFHIIKQNYWILTTPNGNANPTWIILHILFNTVSLLLQIKFSKMEIAHKVKYMDCKTFNMRFNLLIENF